MSTTGTGAGLGAGQPSLLAFYRPFLPLFGTIFVCLLSVGASLATLPFWVTDRLGGGNLAVGFVVAWFIQAVPLRGGSPVAAAEPAVEDAVPSTIA